jgi:hypothetical protein
MPERPIDQIEGMPVVPSGHRACARVRDGAQDEAGQKQQPCRAHGEHVSGGRVLRRVMPRDRCVVEEPEYHGKRPRDDPQGVAGETHLPPQTFGGEPPERICGQCSRPERDGEVHEHRMHGMAAETDRARIHMPGPTAATSRMMRAATASRPWPMTRPLGNARPRRWKLNSPKPPSAASMNTPSAMRATPLRLRRCTSRSRGCTRDCAHQSGRVTAPARGPVQPAPAASG